MYAPSRIRVQNVTVYISHIFHQFIIIVIYDNVGFPAINSVSHYWFDYA